MQFLLSFLFFLLLSCGYPDIDSVPDFSNIVITEEEAIDFCKITNNDKLNLSKCLNSFYNK